MSSLASPVRASFHPTWWMLAAATLASVALASITLGKAPAIPILWIALVSAYFVPLRIGATGLTPWILRGVLFSVVILTGPEQTSTRTWFVDPVFMTILGSCLLAELAVQHYLPIDGKMRRGQMLVLTGGILACGSATTQPGFIAVIAPLYLVCALAILREFKPSYTMSPVMNAPPPARTSRRWLLHGLSLVLVVTLGFSGGAIMKWSYYGFGGYGVSLMQKLIPLRTMGGMSGDERLGGNYNFTDATGRKLKINGINRLMYLRGLAFERYVNGSWKPDFRRRMWEAVQDFPAPSGKSFSIDRLEDSLDLLYLPLNASGFATPTGSTNQVERGDLAAVQSTTARGETMTYAVGLSASETEQGPLCRKPSTDELKSLLEVPDEIEPGVREIAKAIRQADAQSTIRTTVFYLRNNHTYSLKSSFAGRDPVSQFLLEKKSAHCQFFASAATILLRLNGIPCRYVTGFVAHEAVSKDSMVVRGRDAHAWVEAWVDPVGWITVEATPANGTPEGIAKPIGLYQKIKDFLSDVLSTVGQFIRSLGWQHVAGAGAVLVVVAVSVQSLKNWRARKQRPRIRAYTFPDEEYRRLAVEFELLLKQLGDPPSGSATWSEHLILQREQTQRTGRQAKLDAARQFVEEYNRIRFGRPTDLASLERLKALLTKVKES